MLDRLAATTPEGQEHRQSALVVSACRPILDFATRKTIVWTDTSGWLPEPCRPGPLFGRRCRRNRAAARIAGRGGCRGDFCRGAPESDACDELFRPRKMKMVTTYTLRQPRVSYLSCRTMCGSPLVLFEVACLATLLRYHTQPVLKPWNNKVQKGAQLQRLLPMRGIDELYGDRWRRPLGQDRQ